MARRAVTPALAAVPAATAAPAHAAPGTTAATGPPGEVPASDRKAVALVTGDRVVVDGDRLVP